MQLPDGREMTFARNDPQLRHLAYAYASTVHAAQGQTHERVIAVLDTGAGPLVNQQTLYVQLSRARGQAVVLTDNPEQLVEMLEANTGERLTALEAIGEAVEDRAAAVTAPAKAVVSADAAADFLDTLRAERERQAEAEAALRRLAETQAALAAARGGRGGGGAGRRREPCAAGRGGGGRRKNGAARGCPAARRGRRRGGAPCAARHARTPGRPGLPAHPRGG